MRALGVVMAAVAFLISAPTDGVAQESLSGDWDLTVDTEQGEQMFTVSMVQDGEDLKATGEIPDFGPIEMNGTRDGANIRLQLELDFEGTPIEVIFMGSSRPRSWCPREPAAAPPAPTSDVQVQRASCYPTNRATGDHHDHRSEQEPIGAPGTSPRHPHDYTPGRRC